MNSSWVSVIALLGWLVLAGSALRARQLNARKAILYALIWGAIFFAAAAIFTAIG
ncbi:MAG TPA: hypothetical protein VIC34_10275 [Croceibacterium sp.]|jgi:hypothetical protein